MNFAAIFIFYQLLLSNDQTNNNSFKWIEVDSVVINLEYGNLDSIPQYVFETKYLVGLDISENTNIVITEDIKTLTYLSYFAANGCGLNSLPNSFSSLTKIKTIYLEYNMFEGIPIQIFSLVNIEELYLGRNNIYKIDSSINRLQSLKVVDLSKNNIENIDILGQCNFQSLNEIDLSDNNLSETKVDWALFPNLEYLLLEGNKLEKFSCNSLGIRIIDLRNNNLTEFPICISKLSNLETISLQNNLITEIPLNIEFPPSIKNIYLNGNPINGENLEKFKTLHPSINVFSSVGTPRK